VGSCLKSGSFDYQMEHAVFTYGTLQIPEIMLAVTGQTFRSQSAILPDFARYSIRDKVYPAIVQAAGMSVSGILYSGIDHQTLGLLDVFEDILYERRDVEVFTENTIRSAMTYVIADRYRQCLSPELWDIEQFKVQYLENYLISCREFRTHCEQWLNR